MEPCASSQSQANQEIRCAILNVVRESCGIVPDEIPAAVCRVFGFARVTDEMTVAVEPHRDSLVQESRLVLQGVNLVWAQD